MPASASQISGSTIAMRGRSTSRTNAAGAPGHVRARDRLRLGETKCRVHIETITARYFRRRREARFVRLTRSQRLQPELERCR